MWLKKSFTARKTEIANAAFVQDVQGATELIGVNPAQVAVRNFAACKFAEIAGCIAGIRNGDVAENRTTAANEPQHVPSLICNRTHCTHPFMRRRSTALPISTAEARPHKQILFIADKRTWVLDLWENISHNAGRRSVRC